MPVKGNYAEVVLTENTCPFLTDRKLCRIQEVCGESYLSVTCDNFPRNYNMVNGKLELSLYLSCPQAARLALLDPVPMRFSQEDIKDNEVRISRMSELNSVDSESPNEIYLYFERVREFILALLQNRKYIFEDRLIILGLFCKDLDAQLSHPDDSAIVQLINQYTQRIDNNGFTDLINNIPDKPTFLLKTIVALIEYRIKTDVSTQPFLECFEQFKQGLKYTDEMSDEALLHFYSKAKSDYYDDFMSQHEYIFENYFVNYVFKNLFPFGPQKSIYEKSIYLVSKNFFTEYMLLVIQFAMMKNLLIGMAGYYKDGFETEHIVRFIQLFVKNIDHDVPYLQKLLKFFEDNNSINFSCTAMLIKN